MRKTIPIILALAAAMAMGSAFAEQKGQNKGLKLDQVDSAKGQPVAPKAGQDVVSPRDSASGQATGRRQYEPVIQKGNPAETKGGDPKAVGRRQHGPAVD